MNLYDLFGLDESYRILPNYDTEKYGARPGLEGPMRARNGKVVYYDTKEGKYYDPDTDFYISNDEWDQMNREHVPYGDIGVNEQDKVTTTKKSERMVNLMKAKYPEAQNDIEAILLHFNSGQKQDRSDINTLYSQNDQEEMEIDQLQKELDKLKARRQTNEDYYETDEQRELARLGRILMDMGAKRDDNIGAAMGAVGMELTKYGTPQGVSSIQKLEKVTGQPESVIMKMMALAQKVQGDVAVGDETTDNNDEEVEEGYKKDYLTREKERIGRASDERDVGTNNYEVQIDGKPWKVFRTKASAIKASSTIQNRYNKQTAIYATRKPVSEGVAEDFDTNFKKRIGYTVRGGAASDMMKKQADQAKQQNIELDPGAAEKGLGIGVLDTAKARKKAKEKGVRAPGSLRASPNTRDPGRLPEGDQSWLDTASGTLNLSDAAVVPEEMQAFIELAKNHRYPFKLQTGPNGLLVTGKYQHLMDLAHDAMQRPNTYGQAGPLAKVRADRPTNEAESQMVRATLPNVLFDGARKLERLAKENGVEYSRQGRTVTLTGEKTNVKRIFYKMAYDPGNHPKLTPVNEARLRTSVLDGDDIKIGDIVQTLKMGQMQGTVTGFSKKGGIDKVMFKHKSGKTYATVPENLLILKGVEESVKKTESIEVDSEGAIAIVTMRKDFDWDKVAGLVDRYGVAFEPYRAPYPGKKGTYFMAADYADELEEVGEVLYSYDDTLFNIDELTESDKVVEAKKKPVPTDPSKWSYYKSQAKKKFDVYPSAYANAWAAKQYKAAGGGWRMGKPKKK